MAQDPAFLFYPNDWLGGTMGMTFHQKGCYIELLVAQFNLGPLSSDTIKTVLGQDQASWTVLSSKFKQTAEGHWFNERLEAEKIKRAKYAESRSRNRRSYQESYDDDMTEDMTIHKENRNRNENRNIIKNKNTYGEFGKVLLSEEEFAKLQARFGDKNTKILIDELDGYIASRGKKYQSHYATLLNWARRKITEHLRKTHERQGKYQVGTV